MHDEPPPRSRDVTGEAEQDLETAEALARELGAGEQELHPAAPGDIPPQGSAEVPAHNGNGVPPGLKPNAAKQIGDAAGTAIAGTIDQLLPQMLFDAFATALSQVPVRTIAAQERLCATCLVQRIGWENAHRAEMEKAIAAALGAAGIQQDAPQAAQLNIAAFLPQHLQPGQQAGMPEVRQAATVFQGTEVCPMHIPGVQSAGRTPLLVATAGMSPAMAAQFAGAR